MQVKSVFRLIAPSNETRTVAFKPCAPGENIVPDIVALIIWVVAGVAAGNAIGEFLKGDYDLGPGNTITGTIGGVTGAQVLQTLVPTLGRL
jgi:hypothetical protein